MARIKFIPAALIGLSLAISACAPSPLYVKSGGGTVGEIPRDGRGEPLWSAIRPAPHAAYMQPMPTAQGIPITPPPGTSPRP